MRLGHVSVVTLALCLLPACPYASLLFTPGGGNGAACQGSWDCASSLDCVCGSCQAPGAVGSCEPSPTERGVVCPGDGPDCVADCMQGASAAECTADGWQCPSGKFEKRLCPIGSCTGTPGPGQVCNDGVLVCSNGVAPNGACITPGLCDADGGPTIAPGCVFAPDVCSGGTTACGATWCAVGTRTPAMCAGGHWTCAEGVFLESCPRACELMSPPPCYAECGDERVVSLASCTEDGYFDCVDENAHREGVLRSACPANTCWDERPAGATICENGAWVCGDGTGPSGGCLTPGTCASPAPGCFATLCCTDTPTTAACEENAWTCGALSSFEDCHARPFCDITLDGGIRDAAMDAPDAFVDESDAGTPIDLDAGELLDAAELPDASEAPDAATPVDAGERMPPTVASTPACGDDIFEPNNERSDVTATRGAQYSGLKLCAGDVDWFVTEIDSSLELPRVELRYSGGIAHVEMYSPDGNYIRSTSVVSSDGGSGRAAGSPGNYGPGDYLFIVVYDEGFAITYDIDLLIAVP